MATESNIVCNNTTADRFSILLPEEYNCQPNEDENDYNEIIGIRSSVNAFKWK